MVFTSTVFLYLFLPVALLAFYAVPPRWRVAPLLLMSAIFYAWGEPVLVLLILATGVFTYLWGNLLADRDRAPRRGLLAVGVAVCLVPIATFKYLGFALSVLGLHGLIDTSRLPLPIGVSFYTFMAISYLVDIYRDPRDRAPNLLTFSGFLSMFPHLVAGPIVRWSHIGPQLLAPRFDPGLFGYGALRVSAGLAKKSVLADSLAVVVDDLFSKGPTSMTSAWLAVLLYSLQIYLDFSAYSDIAIGLAAMMGIRFHENFHYPYLARSAREFWQRWHISLGSWFRDYLYIPLGGSRVSTWKLWRNLLVVWGLTGLWHGAAWTFVAWGLYFGLVIGLERTVWGAAVARLPMVVQHVYGLLVVVLGWVFFRAASLTEAVHYFATMFGLSGRPLSDGIGSFALQQTWVAVVVAVLLAAGIGRRFMDRVERTLTHRPPEGQVQRPLDSADVPLGDVPLGDVPLGDVPLGDGALGDGALVDGAGGLRDHGAVPRATGSGVGTATAQRVEVVADPDADLRVDPPWWFSVGVAVLVVALLVLASTYVVSTTYSPFIYFRF